MNPEDWRKKTIAPSSAALGKVEVRYLCPGLGRFCGLIGFLVVGLGVYYGGSALLGLGPLDGTPSHWTGRHLILIAVALLVGGTAGAASFIFGISIKVKHEGVNCLLTVLFQFFVFGGLYWPLAIGLTMTTVMGKEGAKAAIVRYGMEQATGQVTLTGAFVGLALGFLFSLSRSRLNSIFYLASGATITVLLAKWHFQTFGIAGYFWIIPGLITPVLLPIVCRPSIASDLRERRVLLEN